MKKISILLILLCIFMLSIMYSKDINNFFIENFTNNKKEVSIFNNNSYASSDSYMYIQLTNSFEPSNKQDIMNIYYTVLNSGMSEFTFYCPNSYNDCITDVDYISNNQVILSDINNFIPVYNSFSNVETEFDSTGKVTITIKHNYNDSDINILEDTINNIMSEIINNDMTTEDKIKAVHDYIINNTKYDIDRSDNKINTYHSDTAYGALIEHYAICGGYADSMKLFLEHLGITNYKISSENHVWNLVKIDNNWYHLDLTWDDPVTSTGEDVLEYDYFLISTSELNELESDQHIFDNNIYQEAI